MAFSYWEREGLLGRVDHVVVGAGIVGMSCALALRERLPGATIRVIDRSALGDGGTTRNAGFACFGSPSELFEDLEALGKDAFLELVERRWSGLQRLKQRLGEDGIGFQPTGSWEIFTGLEGVKSAARVSRCLGALNLLLEPVLGPDIFRPAPEAARAWLAVDAVHSPLEGIIDTAKMVRSFWRLLDEAGIERVNGLEVTGFEEGCNGKGVRISTPHGSLDAGQAWICTNAMATELLDDLGKVLLVKPSPNRVLVTEKLSSLPMEGAFHSERGFIYYRTVDGRILIGGGRHWGHDKDWVYSSDGKQALSIMVWDNQLIDFISDRLGYKPTIEHRWMGWIGVGKKRMPLIGSASDRIHYAVRLGGMGVAIGMEVGESLVEHGLGAKM